MIVEVDRLIGPLAGRDRRVGRTGFPVALWAAVLRVRGRRGGAAASGRDTELPDPGEHDREQVVAGWQPQRQAPLVADEARWNAQQLVPQSGGVRATIAVDPGQGLEQGREVPGQERCPHPHSVDRLVPGGKLAQRRAEFGLTDPVLDVGAAPVPGLDLKDRLSVTVVIAGLVVGGDVGDDEGDRVRVGRGAFQGEGELVLVDGSPPPRPGSAEMSSASTRTRRTIVYVPSGHPAGA